jgi:hypothetical protein
MTAQIGDRLLVDGKAVTFMGCPALPWHHPRFQKLSKAEALELCRGRPIFSTACWRNYVADWHIDSGRVYLDRITGIYRPVGEKPLFADWMTETLRIVCGARLANVHMGFGSVFEEDLLLDVQRGVVVGQTRRDNRGRTYDVARLG